MAAEDWAATFEQIRLDRRWTRNYTGVWHLGWADTRRTYCPVRLRSAGIEAKQTLGPDDVACERCAKTAPAHDATIDLPRGRRR